MSMRRLLKKCASVILIPLTEWYLRKERKYTFRGTTVTVMPGVFHPGIFHSTLFILQYLDRQVLAKKSFLELGSGTGLISIMAAKAKAYVTATDLSLRAIENTRKNARLNYVEIQIIHSDLFNSLEKKLFDWIIINPPYYPKNPQNDKDLAWYCGADFEYFQNLFGKLNGFISPKTQVIMVLTKACNLEKLFIIGKQSGFEFHLLAENRVFFDEKDLLFQITFTAFDGH